MNYIPTTDAERQAMLATVGVAAMADLFGEIPAAHKFPTLALPPALSELEVLREVEALAARNDDLRRHACFLGAGAYRHFIPSVVDFVLGRAEFYTAYTPYQPEISQGTLQAHFEYQSLICALTGMEAANVSHYDGATAAAEAVILALGVTKGQRQRVVLAPTLAPQTRAVIRTYSQGMAVTLVEDAPRGDLAALAGQLDGQTACVIVQNPDFLGHLSPPSALQTLADAAHAAGALLIVSVDPISLGLFEAPGAYGADVVIGDGQPLGNPVSFGGPSLGFFTTKLSHIRKTAGRIVGQAMDADGQRGFVLTLSSREQHIRRERASSNICSNQALNALAAAVYLSVMGPYGLRTVAELCYHKAHYAAARIGALAGYRVTSAEPFFKEFLVRCPHPVAEINRRLLERFGLVGGYDVGRDYPDLADHMLLCVTEMNPREEIDALVAGLGTM